MANKGAKMPRNHITTPQEIHHQIRGAKFYTEMDMGHGFYQVPLRTQFRHYLVGKEFISCGDHEPLLAY